MAGVEITTVPAGLLASEQHVKAFEEAVNVTEIEPSTEKSAEEEAPASIPAEEVSAAEKTVDESPAAIEKSAEELTVTPPASEPAIESAQLGFQEVAKQKEEGTQVPGEAKRAKEKSVSQSYAEAAKDEEKSEETSCKEDAPAALERVAEEKAEQTSPKKEAPVEIPDEKTTPVEESAVQEAKPAGAVLAEEKAEGEGEAEE